MVGIGIFSVKNEIVHYYQSATTGSTVPLLSQFPLGDLLIQRIKVSFSEFVGNSLRELIGCLNSLRNDAVTNGDESLRQLHLGASPVDNHTSYADNLSRHRWWCQKSYNYNLFEIADPVRNVFVRHVKNSCVCLKLLRSQVVDPAIFEFQAGSLRVQVPLSGGEDTPV